jgi:hypothetical protein
MFSKIMIGGVLMAAFLAMPVQAAETIKKEKEIVVSVNDQVEGNDCFYEQNRDLPECRK